ncbi:MAG: hypothetical protein GC164_13165 [Phycisphaera sp.]|nr:hypothetical protein [Phycisphaera sp.]
MAKRRNPTKTPATRDPGAMLRYASWAVLAGVWVLLVASLGSYDAADWPGHSVAPYNAVPQNYVGRVGAFLAYHIYLMVGPGAWIVLTAVAVYLVATAMGKSVSQVFVRLLGVTVMGLAASAIVDLGTQGVLPGFIHAHMPGGGPEGAGGLIALFVNTELSTRFGGLGATIIVAVFFWIGAVLAVDDLVMLVPRTIGRACLALGKIPVPKPVLVGAIKLPWSGRIRQPVSDDTPTSRAATIPIRNAGRNQNPIEEPIDEDAGGLGGTESFDPDQHQAADKETVQDTGTAVAEAELDDDDDINDDSEAAAEDAPGAYVAEKKLSREELLAKIKQLPINFAPKNKAKNDIPREVDLSGYQFPGLDILIEPESNFTEEIEQIVRDQALHLESALQQYRIEGEVVGIDSGPVITLYEVRLAPGTKVSQLGAIDSDLARALKAPNIRIVPNMAGKDTVGIEVPNLKKEKVRLKELMTVHTEQTQSMKLPMFLGKDASGNPLIADLSTMPHMLIAGTTGSGKSVCMNSIIMSFLFTKRPDELKLVLVDPKMVEMSMFKDIPHLMCPVVTEMNKAAAILEWATTKMDERYELLAEAGVRDIAGYNSLDREELIARFAPANEAEEARIPKKLPYMVFVIDELADLMMTNKEVEGFIVRIAQKARAVGIHLILATQRPQANVVTGLIKSNMPCRVSFKVASGMDSRIVLDQKGAELLLGQGDMLYLSPRTSKLTRAQGTLVDDGEIRKTARFLKEIAEQNFEPSLVQIKAPGSLDGDDTERDPLFDDAVRVVLESKRGSVSLLQRRLTIGYSRSSRLIEQMAEAGILGDYKGSQAREVLLSLEEWEALREQAQSEQAMADGEQATDEADEEDNEVPDEFDDEYRQ